MEAQIEKQLDKILPEDLARTFESAYHVFQGKTEHVDDLLKNGGILLRKAAQRFTPIQMIIGIAAVAAVAVALAAGITNAESLLRQATAWSAAAVLMPLAGEISPQYARFIEELVVDRLVDEPRL